ncbi:MAG: hypothetical protein CO149_06220 [Nitrospirae bacterium CG_4_9_14_3_um_filter_51_5]|nr:MAG: hypothetical protein CO149_06220 [Nitrospirae bacterium CG_4_9_14_3_um_filter_51_5]
MVFLRDVGSGFLWLDSRSIWFCRVGKCCATGSLSNCYGVIVWLIRKDGQARHLDQVGIMMGMQAT